MHYNADLIVLDEPTAALGVAEVRKVLDFVRRIKSSGRACIYIEHNLAHVHEVADRLVVLDRGRVVAEIIPKDMSVLELTEYLIDAAARGVSGRRGCQRSAPSVVQRIEGAADHHRLRAAARPLHVPRAGGVPAPYIYTTFLSTLPPLILLAVGLTFVIGAGEIDLCFPVDHRLFRLRLRGAVQGIRPRLAGRRSPRLGVGACSSASSTASSSPRSASRPSWRRSAPSSSGPAWRPCSRAASPMRCAAPRRARSGSVIVGRPFAASETDLVAAAADPGAVDGDHRRLPLVRPQPPPLRRARALHRRFERRLARRRHRRRAREDQASSR